MIDFATWVGRLDTLAPQYRQSEPFPHIHIDAFLDSASAHALEAEFPQRTSEAWTQYKHINENKTGLTKRDQIPGSLGLIIDELNSPEFVAWLARLTGIPDLIADPSLEGGGLHQSARGGFLNVHADFTVHHHQPTWQRRVNVILYLNDGWQEEWGGAIELWDRQMTKVRREDLPAPQPYRSSSTQNEVSILPSRTRCSARTGVSRKGVALYYYSGSESESRAQRRTRRVRKIPQAKPP